MTAPRRNLYKKRCGYPALELVVSYFNINARLNLPLLHSKNCADELARRDAKAA